MLFGLNCLVTSNLLASSQRLVALYLLGHHQASLPSSASKSTWMNPFLIQLVSIYDCNQAPSYEKALVFWLLKTQEERAGSDNTLDKQIGIYSPKQLIDMYDASLLDSDAVYVLALGDNNTEYSKIKSRVVAAYGQNSNLASTQINNILRDSQEGCIESERVHA